MGELLSMTGYGSAKGVVEGLEVTVELKSVNNRYLDCNVRMPRNLLFAEETVKQAVSASVGRGKVDVFVSAASSANSDMTVAVNHDLAKGYYEAVCSIADSAGIAFIKLKDISAANKIFIFYSPYLLFFPFICHARSTPAQFAYRRLGIGNTFEYCNTWIAAGNTLQNTIFCFHCTQHIFPLSFSNFQPAQHLILTQL